MDRLRRRGRNRKEERALFPRPGQRRSTGTDHKCGRERLFLPARLGEGRNPAGYITARPMTRAVPRMALWLGGQDRRFPIGPSSAQVIRLVIPQKQADLVGRQRCFGQPKERRPGPGRRQKKKAAPWADLFDPDRFWKRESMSGTGTIRSSAPTRRPGRNSGETLSRCFHPLSGRIVLWRKKCPTWRSPKTRFAWGSRIFRTEELTWDRRYQDIYAVDLQTGVQGGQPGFRPPALSWTAASSSITAIKLAPQVKSGRAGTCLRLGFFSR
jgi:hypothetical protein